MSRWRALGLDHFGSDIRLTRFCSSSSREPCHIDSNGHIFPKRDLGEFSTKFIFSIFKIYNLSGGWLFRRFLYSTCSMLSSFWPYYLQHLWWDSWFPSTPSAIVTLQLALLLRLFCDSAVLRFNKSLTLCHVHCTRMLPTTGWDINLFLGVQALLATQAGNCLKLFLLNSSIPVEFHSWSHFNTCTDCQLLFLSNWPSQSRAPKWVLRIGLSTLMPVSFCLSVLY